MCYYTMLRAICRFLSITRSKGTYSPFVYQCSLNTKSGQILFTYPVRIIDICLFLSLLLNRQEVHYSVAPSASDREWERQESPVSIQILCISHHLLRISDGVFRTATPMCENVPGMACIDSPRIEKKKGHSSIQKWRRHAGDTPKL